MVEALPEDSAGDTNKLTARADRLRLQQTDRQTQNGPRDKSDGRNNISFPSSTPAVYECLNRLSQ